MRRRRSWHTSFRQLALRSNAVCQADDIGALAQERTSALLPPSQTHTSLSHTPSFPHIHTHIHDLSSPHTIFHIPLFHTHNCFNFSILLHLLCLSFLPRPCYNIWCSLLEEVDLWGYPVLKLFFTTYYRVYIPLPLLACAWLEK